MSTAEPSKPTQRPRQPAARRLLLPLLLFLVPILIAAGVAGYFWFSVPKLHYGEVLRYTVVSPTTLDARFTDADGDLVADLPTDPAQLIDPDTLVFSTLGSDIDREKEIWKDFTDHLKKATGKEVVHVLRYYTWDKEINEMRDGKVHVQCLNTGLVPTAVNLGGFVPVCVMAAPDGSFGYEVQIIVPAGSSVNSLKDLMGKTIALTSTHSLSSFKAPIVLLWEEGQMYPGRDYDFVQTGGQERSILGVGEVKSDEKKYTGKKYDAAAVASDLLQRAVEENKLDPASFRTIYRSSAKYPPACFGHSHNLTPELAQKVREAFLNFTWKGTSLEKAYQPANQTRFVPVSYKEGWEQVRHLDRSMNQLVEQKP
jgi:phosphonate transport system substrate-binding protein